MLILARGMSLEKLQLPEFVFAELFKDHLVITDDVAAINPAVPNKPILPSPTPTPNIVSAETGVKIPTNHVPQNRFLGNNAKNIVLLVRDNEAVHLRDEWLNTLGKLLAALKMNLNDVAIVNTQHQSCTFEQLQQLLQPRYVLLFGVGTQELALPFMIPDYQAQPFNQCIFIQASASTLSNNNTDALIKAEKMKLWQVLKTTFA